MHNRTRGFSLVLVIIVIGIASVIIYYISLIYTDTEKSDSAFLFTTQDRENAFIISKDIDNEGPPSGLSLPFEISDIDNYKGGVNPFGVVRGSKDMVGIGHGGIDMPLFEGAKIKAVADGEIIIIKSAGDPWGGKGIFQLLEKTGEGEVRSQSIADSYGGQGWGFIYEHVIPSVREGDVVKRGQVIATKAAPERFTMHLQMSRLFSNYEYTDTNTCWSDLLDESDRDKLMKWWNGYRLSDNHIDGWMTVTEDGKYTFRGLIEGGELSEFCYPDGTDVR